MARGVDAHRREPISETERADSSPSSSCSASQRSPPRVPLVAIDHIVDDPDPANRFMLSAIFSGMRSLTRKGAIKRKRFSEERIAFTLRQAESGTTIEDICRKAEISEPTFYHWSSVHGGLVVTEIREREVEACGGVPHPRYVDLA